MADREHAADGPIAKTALSELERLEQANCLIKLEYPYHPRRRPWNQDSQIFKLLDSGRMRYAQYLRDFATLAPHLERIPVHSPDDGVGLAPNWVNGWFPGMDSICLYGLLATQNPRWYVEVGSGNSTKFARQAIKDHGLRTQIISIDPFPRADIDQICDRVLRQPCEDVAPEFFASLTSEDILFVDNSHRSFANSDVTVFFTEILPQLPQKMIYGLHDIFLPWDYPDEWKDRYYSEQYLLTSYLLGGAAGDEIILPIAFLSYYDEIQQLAPLEDVLTNPKLMGIEKTGVAFWLRRA